MKKIKLYFTILLTGSWMLSCNSDEDNLGLQFFDENTKGKVEAYDLVVYNSKENGVIRSDSYALEKAVLGVFQEDKFGMQKAAYATQIRMNAYAPKFGDNPVVDSVVLEFQPEYHTESSSIKTSTSNLMYNGVEAKKTVTSYKAIKYGKDNKNITFKVAEVTEDLGAVGTEIYSDKKVKTGKTLGTKVFNGNFSSVNITAASEEKKVLLARDAGVRISLDKGFFQTKIMGKSGASELGDEKSFVNYFKGLQLYVEENDGCMIAFTPNNIKLKMYYTSGVVGDRKSMVQDFDLGSTNVHFSQVSYNRSQNFKSVISNINTSDGDPLVYLQGMGGAKIGIKLESASIANLKKESQQKKSAIVSAKVRLYVSNTWNNTYTKPVGFLVKEMGSSDFITDLRAMYSNRNYKLVTPYSNNNTYYYDIDITKTIKDIVEKNAVYKDLVVSVGDYLTEKGSLVKEDFNSGVYSPYRVVLVGSDRSNPNRAKLMVTRVVK